MNSSESWPTDPRQCHDLLSRLTQQVDNLQTALDQATKLHAQQVEDFQARSINPQRSIRKPCKSTSSSSRSYAANWSSTAVSSLAHGGNDWSKPRDRDTYSSSMASRASLRRPNQPTSTKRRRGRVVDHASQIQTS